MYFQHGFSLGNYEMRAGLYALEPCPWTVFRSLTRGASRSQINTWTTLLCRVGAAWRVTAGLTPGGSRHGGLVLPTTPLRCNLSTGLFMALMTLELRDAQDVSWHPHKTTGWGVLEGTRVSVVH